jgi:hypothetical protein
MIRAPGGKPMDIWRSAIVRQTVGEIAADGIDPGALVWLPEMPRDRFRADPFGLWRADKLYVFAEAFDYRNPVGRIDALVYDRDLNLLDQRVALREPWHLSYPFVFEAQGETWMLPEAYKSGTTTLYRARDFPFGWQAVAQIALDGPAIDATPFFHRDRWWLFYAPSQPAAARRGHLHVAWAAHPAGPWHLHPGNPVRVDAASARPGGTPFVQGGTPLVQGGTPLVQGGTPFVQAGTPFVHTGTPYVPSGAIVLPVQDCRLTYGGALRALVITRLDETHFEATDRPYLSPPAWLAPYDDGCHTLAAAGPVTLIDFKRMDRSARARGVRLAGIVRRWATG